MYKYYSALLVGLLLCGVLVSVAVAQSLGLGMGTDDLYPGKGSGVVPAADALLIQTGSSLLINTGNRFLVK